MPQAVNKHKAPQIGRRELIWQVQKEIKRLIGWMVILDKLTSKEVCQVVTHEGK